MGNGAMIQSTSIFNPSNQNSRPLAPADGIPGGTLTPILKQLEAMDGYVFFFNDGKTLPFYY